MVAFLRVWCCLLTGLSLSFGQTTSESTTSWATEIPLTLAEMLNSETNTPTTEIGEAVSESAADADEEASRSVEVVKAEAAKCEPELQTYNLRDSNDVSITYKPSCTRVYRCGGCCTGQAYECVPKKTVNVTYEIQVRKYPEKEWRPKYIQVEKHIQCECACKLKPAECSPRQYHDNRRCLCQCRNPDEKQKCDQEADIKTWDNNNCTCNCRQRLSCPSDTLFSTSTCQCEYYRG